MSHARKFYAACVGAAATAGAALLTAGDDWRPVVATLITSVSTAAVVYLVPNED